MKSLIRKVFRLLCLYYPRESGKFKILENVYFPLLAPHGTCHQLVTIRNGIRMNLDISEFLQAFIYNFNCYELPTIKFFEKYVKSDFNILDIGANVGQMALTFAKLSYLGKVIAFEPEPINFSRLQQNIELNDFNNLQAVNIALSDNNESIKLFKSKTSNAGTHSVLFNESTVSSDDSIDVSASTGDSFLSNSNINRLDLIKIDVEGFEKEVINGLNQTIDKFRPCLVIEVVDQILENRGYSAIQFVESLKQFGYQPHKISNDGSIKKFDPANHRFNENIVFLSS